MAVYKSFLFFIIFVHFLAFALAVLAELGHREVQGIPNVDQTFCLYYTFASTIHGFGACVLMLISQVYVNTITKCLCFSRDLVSSRSATCAAFFFIDCFLGSRSMLAGSICYECNPKCVFNEYFLGHDLSCLILSKGVFAAGAALILFSMLTSILYYWVYSKADTGYWERHHGKIHNLVPELEMA
ncbi:hypothetical protein MtrunA17_Chr1g0209321 [Medicago truncatula]|uniref:Transmembrane protein n=1 Tax=Medicago truncatula TaxID=3880 RepID=A0A396JVM6_MEDTR|nr:hypothetical protein MtrunA17_Chr1g0209321 [Medicago truncatula]